MRICLVITVFFLACILQACQINNTEGRGELLSDGYISFNADGTPIIAHDSLTAGDPSINLLWGTLKDSTIDFQGAGAVFYVVHCHDTGTYLLSARDSAFVHSSASVSVRDAATGYYTTYSTDSLHGGVLHLTRLDREAGRMGGTFEFTARKYNGGESDTISISKGVVFDFPIAVVRD